MAANWNNPVLTSLYTDVLADLKARDVDAITFNSVVGTNLPVGAKRWNAPTNTFQSWDGAAWNNLILSIAGGGTGASSGTPLGTMAFQNANAVAITGGTMSGVALNADALLSGNMPMARMPLGGTWTLTTLPLGLNLNAQYFQIYGGGVFLGSATGGNFGPGTLNAQSLLINGVPLSATPPASIPTGLMAYFSGACPAGWTFVAGSHERMVRSWSGGNGLQHGSLNHDHGFDVPAGGGGAINSGPAIGETSGPTALNGQFRSFDSGSSFSGWLPNDSNNHTHTIGHVHNFNVPGFPGHTGTTGQGGGWLPSIDFSLCRKD